MTSDRCNIDWYGHSFQWLMISPSKVTQGYWRPRDSLEDY